MANGKGTREDPWKLKTPPLSSEYEMYLDEKDGKEVIVCVVGKTTLLYDRRARSSGSVRYVYASSA
jgi:hypothetical protein